MAKERLDVLMTQRGVAESRERAQALVLEGKVRVDGGVVTKPGTAVRVEAEIAVEQPLPYVSRGGYKLAGALDEFALSPEGCVCADIGASTGGFTDVLLQRGAQRVYAIDVGYGQLAWKIRQDPRVVVMDRTNVRYLPRLPEPVSFVVIDVSFISLEIVLRRVAGQGEGVPLATHGAQVVALVKPQFEAGRGQVGKGGIVRDPQVHRAVLEKICGLAGTLGLSVRGLMVSPIQGTEGNREFLAHLRVEPGQSIAWRERIDAWVRSGKFA